MRAHLVRKPPASLDTSKLEVIQDKTTSDLLVYNLLTETFQAGHYGRVGDILQLIPPIQNYGQVRQDREDGQERPERQEEHG